MSCEDQALADTKHCDKFGCDRARLAFLKGYWVCPICGGSYGARPFRGCERRVVEYSVCRACGNNSIGVMANGRIVRHSITFGSVERLRRGSRLRPTPICKGSNKPA